VLILKIRKYKKKYKDKLQSQIKKKLLQMRWKNKIIQNKNVQLVKMIGLIIVKKKKRRKKIILAQLINLQGK
jgi:hypothetical protein